MTSWISKAFSDLGIGVQNEHVRKLEDAVTQFETRGTHVLALNTQMLGTQSIVFTSADRAFLFELFDLKESELAKMIRKIPSINTDHRVASDSFNLLSMWLLHSAHIFLKNDKARASFQRNIVKYMHYRFFTSIVNYYFSHGAKEDVMTATINNLSGKFDIITYGTWKATLEARTDDFLSDKSIHKSTILNMDDDEHIKRAITDLQTRIRDKIKNIANAYYDNKDKGVQVKSQSRVIDDNEGEKRLSQSNATIDSMITAITSDLMNKNRWIQTSAVSSISRQFTTISQSMLKSTLEDMSAIAQSQAKRKTVDIITENKDGTVTVGMRALVREIIRFTYRYMVINRIPMTNKVTLYNKIQSTYASSRISDKGINDVKTHMYQVLDDMGKTSREATKASLRIAVIMYIIVKTFRYL